MLSQLKGANSRETGAKLHCFVLETPCDVRHISVGTLHDPCPGAVAQIMILRLAPAVPAPTDAVNPYQYPAAHLMSLSDFISQSSLSPHHHFTLTSHACTRNRVAVAATGQRHFYASSLVLAPAVFRAVRPRNCPLLGRVDLAQARTDTTIASSIR